MKIAGIVAVDRAAILRRSGDVLAARTASLKMSPAQVFGAYQGLDGVPWPSPPFEGWEDVGLIDVSELETVRDLVAKSGVGHDIDIVALAQGPVVKAMQELGWQLLGYDVGYFESRWSHFSVLLNEVVYGSVPNIRAYAKALNSNLLLDTDEDAAALLAIRAGEASSDIEDGQMSIFGVLRRIDEECEAPASRPTHR